MSKSPRATDDEVEGFLTGYALRFDGYRFAESREQGDLLAKWTNHFVKTLRMADDSLVAHAVFFALQRFLCKWGGEALSRQSREQLAYRLLFLHLYRAEVPTEFSLDGGAYARDLDPHRLEAVAARVREQLIELTLDHGDPVAPAWRPNQGESGGGSSGSIRPDHRAVRTGRFGLSGSILFRRSRAQPRGRADRSPRWR